MRLETDSAGRVAGGGIPEFDKSGWEAKLNLGFSCREGKTILSERRHRGPLTVQRPFYAEDGGCHVYLLHPPGGMVGGDALNLSIVSGSGSAALITTPAAAKCYRSSGSTATQSVTLNVEDLAALEWLPQEMIVYNGARLRSAIRIDLGDNARFIGWDLFVFGRPASGERFAEGFTETDWRIYRDGRPLLVERTLFDAAAIESTWGLQGNSACGTLVAAPASAVELAEIRELVGELPGFGLTLLGDLLVCRGVHARSDRLRALFEDVWAALRPRLLQRPLAAPRIWAY